MSATISEKRKNTISTIHKSDIFFQSPVETQPLKIRENLKSQIEFNLNDAPNKQIKRKDNEFQPKFKDENAFSRRIKEVYGSNENLNNSNRIYDSNNLPTSSIGHISKNKTANNTFDRKDFSELTFKEKKILENNPKLKREEVKLHVQKMELNKLKSNAEKDVDIMSKVGDNSKETYYNHQESNIFNSKKPIRSKMHNYSIANRKDILEKTKLIQDKKNKEKESEINDHKKRIPVDSAWSCNLDWKDINGPLYFHRPEANLKSAKLNKLKELKSNFSIAHDDTNHNNNIFYAKEDEQEIIYNNTDVEATVNSNIRNEIEKEIKNKYIKKIPSAKLQKSLDLSSSIHGSEFYSKSLKINTVDRPIKAYEIDNLKNFENFNTKQIKDLYSNHGIHIYDVAEKGEITNGNSAGSLTYKIRGNNEDPDFSKKCESVINQMKEMGFNSREKEIPLIKVKKQGDIIPINVKWNDNKLRQITGKKASYETKVMVPTKINAEDRISKCVIDHNYKKGADSKKKEIHNTIHEKEEISEIA